MKMRGLAAPAPALLGGTAPALPAAQHDDTLPGLQQPTHWGAGLFAGAAATTTTNAHGSYYGRQVKRRRRKRGLEEFGRKGCVRIEKKQTT